MENFILITTLLLVGVLLKRLELFPENTSQVLNQFVIYVSLPALVLYTVPKLIFSLDLIASAIVPWALLIFSAGLLLLFAKAFNWSRNTLGALLLIVPLGNTSFLGVPMVRAFFGDNSVVYAIMYDQVGSFLALALYGSVILAVFNKRSSHSSNKKIVKKALIMVVTFPPFISLIIALCLHFVNLPNMYFNILSPIAMTLVPVVMIAVGFQLTLKLDSNKISPFIIGLTIKMFLAPLLALLVFLMLGLKGEIYQVIVFEAAMPPMISAGALAIIANLSPKLTAAMLAYGILLAFITLPIVYTVLQYTL